MLSARQISVIISTYDSPTWLEKVLIGYTAQTLGGFEIVVADDGSGPKTRSVVESMTPFFSGGVQHVWHEHQGFRKSRILNRATLAASRPYLVFTDGDCIPRRDFVATHARRARTGCFLSGGAVKLPTELSRRLDREEILGGRAFRPGWLLTRGLRSPHALAKLWPAGPGARALDALTPAEPSWNGHNSSGWRRDILAVNGFDERMEYGGQDRELGERLLHAGVHPVQIRHSAVILHLDHARSYKTAESLRRNAEIRRATRARQATWTEFGIVPGPRPESASRKPESPARTTATTTASRR